ncbi:MAG: nitroreductase/quinone reductase family protein [Candidatus Binatia bacterium]
MGATAFSTYACSISRNGDPAREYRRGLPKRDQRPDAMANPFASTRGYARLSNLVMAPVFRLLPVPRGFALLTVTGRRSGRLYSRPVRAVRGAGDALYVVAMIGERSDWPRNIRTNAQVLVKLGRHTHGGLAQV